MDKITAEDILDDKDFKEIIDDDVATAEEIANILNVCTYITDIVNDEDEGALQEVLEAIPNVTPVLTRVGKILVTNLRELQLKLLKLDPKRVHIQNAIFLEGQLREYFDVSIARELAVHFYLTRQLTHQRPSGNVSQLLNDPKMLKVIGKQLIKPAFGSMGSTLQEVLKVMLPVVKDAFGWTHEYAVEVAISVHDEYMRVKRVFVEEKYALDCAKKHIELFF